MEANFVIPSWSYWKEPLRAQPLTQLYLATILEEKGVDIDFTDFRDGPKKINKADLYLYTIASPDYKEVQGIVKRIKKQYPKAKHVVGGPHPTILPNDTKGFDSIVIGRGEESLLEIIDDYPNLKSEYSIPANGDYPFPNRHFLSYDKIVIPDLFKTDKLLSTTAQFSFGCPFTCSFCANYDSGKIRRNSLEKTADEIDYLKYEYGIEGLSLQDEIAIPIDFKKSYHFLSMMQKQNVKWRGQIRVIKNDEILKLAKNSGLVELSFGLESVNQDVLDLTNKKIKVCDVENMIYACKEIGIKTRIYLLNGLPGEKKSIVNEVKEFINKTNPDLVLLSSLQPYPGSPIAKTPKKYGIEYISKEWDKFNHLICRFDDSKDNPENAVPYKFYKNKGLTRKQIINNMLELQEFLRERGANK